jgi:hypothetical protein
MPLKSGPFSGNPTMVYRVGYETGNPIPQMDLKVNLKIFWTFFPIQERDLPSDDTRSKEIFRLRFAAYRG